MINVVEEEDWPTASSAAVIFLRHSSSLCGAVITSVVVPLAMAWTSCAKSEAPVPRFGLSISASGTWPRIAGRRIGVSIRAMLFALRWRHRRTENRRQVRGPYRAPHAAAPPSARTEWAGWSTVGSGQYTSFSVGSYPGVSNTVPSGRSTGTSTTPSSGGNAPRPLRQEVLDDARWRVRRHLDRVPLPDLHEVRHACQPMTQDRLGHTFDERATVLVLAYPNQLPEPHEEHRRVIRPSGLPLPRRTGPGAAGP